MLDTTLRLYELDSAINDLADLTGIQPPQSWRDARQRIEEFKAIDNPTVTAQIAAKVRDGSDPDELLRLITFAAATQNGDPLRDVHRAVLKMLMPHLTDLAGRHGHAAFAALVKKFNTAADKLTAGVKVAVPTITADEALRADSAVQAAYKQRADILTTLAALHTGLQRAAELTGARFTRDTAASLVVDFDKVTPEQNREVWGHIDPDSKHIDWTSLAALGVLGARPLGTPASPRHPGLQERWEQNRFGHGRRLFDPIANAYVN